MHTEKNRFQNALEKCTEDVSSKKTTEIPRESQEIDEFKMCNNNAKFSGK